MVAKRTFCHHLFLIIAVCFRKRKIRDRYMYVYIIECNDNSLYTGIAKDIVQRLRQHYYRLNGCAKYTQSHQMMALKCLWTTDDEHTARQLEYRIKHLSRSNKIKLIDTPELIVNFFADKIDCDQCHFVSTDEQSDIFYKVKNAEVNH